MLLKLFLFVLASVNAKPTEIDGDAGLIGGENAPSSGIPYQVSIRAEGSHLGGGSILSSRWILTSAHWIPFGPEEIVVGTNYISQGGERYRIVYTKMHELFNIPDILSNDIGLIKVDRDIAFNNRVKPINLPTSDVAGGTNLLVSGWGLVQDGGSFPEHLQMLNVTSITNQDCKGRYPHFPFIDSHLCTFVKGKGVCSRDSGGPLVLPGTNVQVGVVSAHFEECAGGYPDMSVRVYPYVNWIRSNMNETLFMT